MTEGLGELQVMNARGQTQLSGTPLGSRGIKAVCFVDVRLYFRR